MPARFTLFTPLLTFLPPSRPPQPLATSKCALLLILPRFDARIEWPEAGHSPPSVVLESAVLPPLLCVLRRTDGRCADYSALTTRHTGADIVRHAVRVMTLRTQEARRAEAQETRERWW